ncbi:MAG: hypothetical protein HPY67_09170 [Syntrophaceae bacterium]|nr:hypothetical protein [Syntrophaceae bacterium]
MKAPRVASLLCAAVMLIGLSAAPPELNAQVSFTGPELLSRPTDTSVTVNVVLNAARDVYVQYGTSPGSYTGATGVYRSTANVPLSIVISGLLPNTQYYYRVGYRFDSGYAWNYRSEHSFRTQRAPGSTFTFTISSDSHLGHTFSGNSPDRYQRTTQNIAANGPDFHIDLGDAFIISSDLGVDTQAEADTTYLNQRPYFGNFSHSAPVFLAIGNHENEEGWNLDDVNSKALFSINARKRYFPNPIPNGFYSGNTDLLAAITGDDKHREDYYAWTWGDVLFVVLDPFQYTMTKPYGNVIGSGEDNDEVVSGDQWNWTLGLQQFNWFKQTLQNSTAKYKFVFSHHVVGGQLTVSNPEAGPPTYVRGGAVAAPYFEWGGQNSSGTPVFETQRPGWGADPIHQLMRDNGVSAFFHGHDHQFVHELRDGIVYQLVPAAGMTGYGFDLYDTSPYVVSGGNLPNAGHVRVTVTPTAATVDYIRSCITGDGCTNGTIAHTYTIAPNVTPCPGDLNGDRQVNAADLAIFAANYGLSGSGDYNGDGDVDGHDLATLVGAFGTVCP